MARTKLTPVSAYLQPSSKKRLDHIVEATSHRITISKLLDEVTEMSLSYLEAKYLGKRSPAHENHTNN